jgi:hypothetical protein
MIVATAARTAMTIAATAAMTAKTAVAALGCYADSSMPGPPTDRLIRSRLWQSTRLLHGSVM